MVVVVTGGTQVVSPTTEARFTPGLYPGCRIIFHTEDRCVSICDSRGGRMLWPSGDQKHTLYGIKEVDHHCVAELIAGVYGYTATRVGEYNPNNPIFEVVLYPK